MKYSIALSLFLATSCLGALVPILPTSWTTNSPNGAILSGNGSIKSGPTNSVYAAGFQSEIIDVVPPSGGDAYRVVYTDDSIQNGTYKEDVVEGNSSVTTGHQSSWSYGHNIVSGNPDWTNSFYAHLTLGSPNLPIADFMITNDAVIFSGHDTKLNLITDDSNGQSSKTGTFDLTLDEKTTVGGNPESSRMLKWEVGHSATSDQPNWTNTLYSTWTLGSDDHRYLSTSMASNVFYITSDYGRPKISGGAGSLIFEGDGSFITNISLAGLPNTVVTNNNNGALAQTIKGTNSFSGTILATNRIGSVAIMLSNNVSTPTAANIGANNGWLQVSNNALWLFSTKDGSSLNSTRITPQ